MLFRSPALPPPPTSLTGAAITLAKLAPIPQSPRGRTPETGDGVSGPSSRSPSRARTVMAVTPTATGASLSTSGSDYFGQKSSAESASSPVPPTSPTSAGGLMGRLRGFGRGSKRPSAADQTPAIAEAPAATEETADEAVVVRSRSDRSR